MSDSVVKDLLLPDSGNSVHYDFTALHINQLSFSSYTCGFDAWSAQCFDLRTEKPAKRVTWFGRTVQFRWWIGGGKRNHPQCEDPEKHTDHKMEGRLLFPVEGNSSQSVCLFCWSS